MRLAALVVLGAALSCGGSVAPLSMSPAATPAPAPSFAPRPAPAAPPVAAAPTPDLQGPDRLVGLDFDAGELRETPPEVERELKHMSESYRSLPALRRLPDFLSVDALLLLMPAAAGERDSLREEIHQQLEGGDAGPLLGQYLDEEQRVFALWLRGNLTQVLAVYDGRRLASTRVVSRGRPMLGDLLDEQDGLRAEILIERITSMSVCCHPMSLDVLRVSRRGVLTQVLSFPKGRADVGPGVRWSFLNHFEFNAQRVVISSAHPGGGPSYELVYDQRVGRYLPTAETAKQLESERRERAKLKASGQLFDE